MRMLGIAIGLIVMGIWTVYKNYRRDTSVCAKLFSPEEIERWAGEPIARTSGGVKDHLCSYMATAQDRGFELHRDMMGVEISSLPYATMLQIHTRGKRSTAVTSLGVTAMRYPDVFQLEAVLVDLGVGSLIVSVPPRVAEQHLDEILALLKTRLDPLRAAVKAHEDDERAKFRAPHAH
jgi:hypothetical protein